MRSLRKCLNVLGGKLKPFLLQIIHYLFGVLTVLMYYHEPLLSVYLFVSFYVYEITEFLTVRDTIHYDVLAYTLGLTTGAVLL